MTEPSSAEASRVLEQRASDSVARVKRRPDGRYVASKENPGGYLGQQRSADPWREDEAEAVAVIELIAGGRLCVYADRDGWMRVETRPTE